MNVSARESVGVMRRAADVLSLRSASEERHAPVFLFPFPLAVFGVPVI